MRIFSRRNTACSTLGTRAILALALVASLGAQTNAPSAAEIDQIVGRFFDTADRYARTVRDLMAEETAVNQELESSGRVRKEREVVSDLVIYRSTRGGDVTEYREVRLVDGKAVDPKRQRITALLEHAAHAATVERELKLVALEGLRYTFNCSLAGMVMDQYFIPRAKRQDYPVRWAGRDEVHGHGVVVLDFEQTTRDVPAALDLNNYRHAGIASFFMRGRLWLDASTAELRRIRWEIAGVHPDLAEPVALLAGESTYVESQYDILVPERIVFSCAGSIKLKGKAAFPMMARTTSTYGTFKKFTVTTDEAVTTPTGR